MHIFEGWDEGGATSLRTKIAALMFYKEPENLIRGSIFRQLEPKNFLFLIRYKDVENT